jgi:hypothetical protein
VTLDDPSVTSNDPTRDTGMTFLQLPVESHWIVTSASFHCPELRLAAIQGQHRDWRCAVLATRCRASPALQGSRWFCRARAPRHGARTIPR